MTGRQTPGRFMQGYKKALRALQIELVSLQRHLIANDLRVLVLFEGRDAAGKDGTIKRITRHLSPRETRVVALGKPSDRDRHSWYFQRYVAALPADQEMVLMNRSWYNRAGVERVMGFCTDAEYRAFIQSVPTFERLLVESGTTLIKYYLDISLEEQKRRLESRREDPLKQWKVSPIDEVALAHWTDYSAARNDMLLATHTREAPWHVIRADHKKRTRLNVIRHLLSQVDYPGRGEQAAEVEDGVVFVFDPKCLTDNTIAP
jgi:polyphosphate kinase 2